MSPFITLTRVRSDLAVRVNALAISFLQPGGAQTCNVFFGAHAIHVSQTVDRIEALAAAALRGEEAPPEPDLQEPDEELSAEETEARDAAETGGAAAQAARGATGGRTAAARAKEATARRRVEAAAKA